MFLFCLSSSWVPYASFSGFPLRWLLTFIRNWNVSHRRTHSLLTHVILPLCCTLFLWWHTYAIVSWNIQLDITFHMFFFFFSFFLILNHHAVDMLLVSKIRFSEVRNCACHFSAWREMMTNHGTAVDAVVAGCSEWDGTVSWCCWLWRETWRIWKYHVRCHDNGWVSVCCSSMFDIAIKKSL